MLDRLAWTLTTLTLAGLGLACGPSGVAASETSTSSSDATTDPTTAESEAGSTGESTDSTEAESGDDATGETGDEPPACALYLRIDLCCNQPFPASPADVEAQADPCVVAWPVDFDALPPDLVAGCVAAQPEFCELVDCDYAEPASEVVELGEDGVCRYVCPEGESIAYAEAGCVEPPPIAGCFLPPPPCADEFCSCEGQTVYGCGIVSEPWAHAGPCP